MVLPRYKPYPFEEGGRAQALAATTPVDGQLSLKLTGHGGTGIASDSTGSVLGYIDAVRSSDGVSFQLATLGRTLSGRLPDVAYSPGCSGSAGGVEYSISSDGARTEGRVETAGGAYDIIVNVNAANSLATYAVTFPDGTGLAQALMVPNFGTLAQFSEDNVRVAPEGACAYAANCKTGGDAAMAIGAVVIAVTGASGAGAAVGAVIAGAGGITWLIGAGVGWFSGCPQ